MNSEATKEVIKVHLKYGSGPNGLGSLYFKGSPGIGKSQTIYQAAEEVGARVFEMRLAQCDPTDLRGIPVPDFDHATARWLAPSELPPQDADYPCVLFLDDFPNAHQQVQNAAYQVAIPPHRLGNYQLPPSALVIAAGNRTEDQSGIHKMSLALANRFRHIDFDFDPMAWRNWASNHGVNEEVLAFLVSAVAQTGSGSMLNGFDPKSGQQSYPTPRTWVAVSDLLNLLDAENYVLSPGVVREMIAGSVGEGAAAQFSTFRETYLNMPDPDEILVKKNFKVTPTKLDLLIALVVAVAQRATPKQTTNVMNWVSTLDPEYGVLLIRMLANRDRASLVACEAFIKWTMDNGDIFL